MTDINSNSVIMEQIKKDQIKKQIEKQIAKEKMKASQKEHNLKYYEKHENLIDKKLCEKVTWSICEKSIIRNNLKKHQLSKICRNTKEFNIEVNKRMANSNLTKFTDQTESFTFK